jgi:RNA polymerase-interacting CarD/CdnL/TRCF family regulator
MRAFAVGDRVSQPQYGAGTVTSVNARHTVIDFDLHGVRTFVTTMVTLEATTEPAPTATKRGVRTKRAARVKAAGSGDVTAADE